MKKLTMVLAAGALLLVSASSAKAQTGFYEWTLSASSTDPAVHTGPAFGGFGNIYLWFAEGCFTGSAGAGMASAEFDININGSINIAAFTPSNGFLNAGGSTSLLLAVGGCPTGPVNAGSFIVTGSGEARIGFAPSAANGILTTVDCEGAPAQHDWPAEMQVKGFATTGFAGVPQAHGSGCQATPVEENSWGSVKSLYQ